MNCPSRVDPEPRDESWNQNPADLAADLTTRADLDDRASRRHRRGHKLSDTEGHNVDWGGDEIMTAADDGDATMRAGENEKDGGARNSREVTGELHLGVAGDGDGGGPRRGRGLSLLLEARRVLAKYFKFIGPGMMISVAYIDPGNYATDVAAGASFGYKHLTIILLSNLIAIFLQSLCVKLGSVTGMNLAENCRAHFPPWLNYTLWFFAEAAIIATDIAEVIGAAIALNLLANIPLVAGAAISIVDVIFILIFYAPLGNMKALRMFEIGIIGLVLGVVCCFVVQLSYIETSATEVLRGYLPSSAIVQSKGLYQACGILGATVMPHSLYLGSGIVQARLFDFDVKHANVDADAILSGDESTADAKYRPSLEAIRSCLKYSIAELGLSLFTFALFVNSAILIVAGAALSNTKAASADLFGIHELLSTTIAPAAGTLFAVALLLSGTSAGIVCTLAGQLVSEGQLNLHMPRWARRLFTRSLSIVPSIIIAGTVGAEGLSAALEGSQVALSVILPFVSAPVIWFTCRARYMTIHVSDGRVLRTEEGNASHARTGTEELADAPQDTVSMKNHWVTAIIAVLIWGLIVIMNGALIVLAAMGIED